MSRYKVIYKSSSYNIEYIVENRETDNDMFAYQFLPADMGKKYEKYDLTMEQQLIIYKRNKKIIERKKGYENNKVIKEAINNLMRLEKLKLLDKKKQ
jgi:hypothetical protein